MNHLLASPALVGAVLVMVSFAVVPKRHRYQQLLMVTGWAAIWLDDNLTGHWLDWTGGLAVLAALGLILRARQAAGHHG